MHDTPSEFDKFDDLKRQYRNFQRDPAVVIFCPWCMRGNKPGDHACCGFFAEGVDRIGKEQLESVARQWREVRLGSKSNIVCPYCDKRVFKSQAGHPADWPRPNWSPFCCDMLSDAATALMERDKLNRLKDDKARIEDVVSAGRN